MIVSWRNLLPVLLLVFSVCGSGKAFAQNSGSPIYQETFARCSNVSKGSGFQSRIEAVWNAFDFRTFRDATTQTLQVASLDPDAIVSLIQNHGMSQRLRERLNSPDFYQALNDCFGQDSGASSTYVAGLIASEATGRVAGVAVIAVAGYVTVKIFGALSAALPWFSRTAQVGFVAFGLKKSLTILHEAFRDATVQEKAEAQAIIDAHMQRPDEFVRETRKLLVDRLDTLIERMNNAQNGEDNVRATEKAKRALDSFDQFELSVQDAKG